jgi:Fe-S-cluster-containing dehydrogenase component
MKHSGNFGKPKRYGMVIDLDKCTGCGACMVACMAENNVPFKEDESKTGQHHLDAGLQGDQRQTLPRCRSLLSFPGPASIVPDKHEAIRPACRFARPRPRIMSTETGIVSQIYTRCFGCRYCMGACPYHARHFNWWDPVWPKGWKNT